MKTEDKDFLARGVNVFRLAIGPLNVKSYSFNHSSEMNMLLSKNFFLV